MNKAKSSLVTIQEVASVNSSHAAKVNRGKNKAATNDKNARFLTRESKDKNALALATIKLADEWPLTQLKAPIVMSYLRSNYGLALSALPLWRDAGMKVRMSAATQAMQQSGNRVVAFTINFSDRIQNTITLKAAAIKEKSNIGKGVCAYIQQQLRSALSTSGITSGDDQVYWFTLEAKKDDAPNEAPYYSYHVHGVMTVPPGISNIDLIRALKKAGGKADRFDNQVHSDKLWFDSGWLSYVTKQTAEMQAHTQDNAYGMSTACKRLAKDHYQTLKRHITEL